jgi:TnpA family transposase
LHSCASVISFDSGPRPVRRAARYGLRAIRSSGAFTAAIDGHSQTQPQGGTSCKSVSWAINAYNQFALPKFWGSGRSASADGTKWSLCEQNLLSEYHVRYGGYRGIGYYHVSDMYIALFSHFIPCGVHEAVYILDGLMRNGSDIKPDTIHGDTQAQSGPVFGLSHVLGINLMPRIRNIGHLVLYKADARRKYRHIERLCRQTIDWALIERHYHDMMRVAVSIKAGKMTPSTILRRLGS